MANEVYAKWRAIVCKAASGWPDLYRRVRQGVPDWAQWPALVIEV